MTSKRKVLLTVMLVMAVFLLVVLALISLIFHSFIISVILRSYIRFLLTGIIIFCVYKAFYKELNPGKTKRSMMICAAVLYLDLCVLDTIRYGLSGGVSTVLFLPVCLPLCFMIITLSSNPGYGTEKKELKRLTYWVGIPLMVLAVYFEVLSFLSI